MELHSIVVFGASDCFGGEQDKKQCQKRVKCSFPPRAVSLGFPLNTQSDVADSNMQQMHVKHLHASSKRKLLQVQHAHRIFLSLLMFLIFF